MANITFFATLNDRMLDAVDYSSSYYDFYYNNKSTGELERLNLDDRDDDQKILIDDPNSNWTPKDNLLIQKSLNFKNPSYFYGANGIANVGSLIGVALVCRSAESNQRIINKVGVIPNVTDLVEIDIKLDIKESTFRGNLIVEVVLYLEEASHNTEKISYLSNIKGTQLGIVESSQLILEGDGSQFPIFIVEDRKLPLWEVSFSFSSSEDMFSDTVKLKINTSHKDYKFINHYDKKSYCQPFLDEIMSNVVSLFIIKCIELNIYDDVSSNDFTSGSVGHMVSYYKDVFAPIDTNSAEEVFASISRGLRDV